MPPLTGLGFLLGLAFYNYFAPLALGWDWFGIRFLQRCHADGAGDGAFPSSWPSFASVKNQCRSPPESGIALESWRITISL
jgi:hypothetical protein